MADVVRAELLKVTKRPAAWVLLAAAAVLNQIFADLIPYLSYKTDDAQTFGGNLPRGEVLASTLPDQLVINTIGLGLGPMLTGWLSDLLVPAFGNESLRYSLLIVCVLFLPWSGWHYLRAGDTIDDDLRRAADRD